MATHFRIPSKLGKLSIVGCSEYTCVMEKGSLIRNFLLVLVLFAVDMDIVSAQSAVVTTSAKQVFQGEPLLVQVDNVESPQVVKKATFDTAEIGVFLYEGKPTALIGVDLNKKPGTYEVMVLLSDGTIIRNSIIVEERKKIEAPLSIPKKLGGNTVASQNKLVSTLSSENKSLSGIHTGLKAFWKTKFKEPLKNVFITDEYGYSRKTGAYSIPHKGADYRATDGTSVMAMNRGVVRIAKTYRNYGKTIVVDHGLGLMTFYMHLSKINVRAGELVNQGQVIGLSGQTGYAEMPHLHLTVRINGASIDPVKFMKLFR